MSATATAINVDQAAVNHGDTGGIVPIGRITYMHISKCVVSNWRNSKTLRQYTLRRLR